MKDSSRRRFILNSSLVAAGLVFLNHSRIKNPPSGVLSCGPDNFNQRTTISSLRSGKWSDPATWGNRIPQQSDTVTITPGHKIIFDHNLSTVAGLTVSEGASLLFDNTKSTTLQSTGNIIVEGLFQMHAPSKTIRQTLRFTNVDEAKFIGGGMDPVATDIGLWVMGMGQLHLEGVSKTSWTNTAGNLSKGETKILLRKPPAGWEVGDEVCFTPTAKLTSDKELLGGFEERTIRTVSGSTIYINKGLSYAHPLVNKQWAAELMNLTRNVRIEGTEKGKSHIFIRSSKPQIIKFVQFRYLGPRKDVNKDQVAEMIKGRYALHFHHSMDGSRGSIVEGNVVRNCDNHSYVPHVSHGIVFRHNIAYNVTETAFWWDEGDPSHNVLWDSNIVALCKFVPRSLNFTNEYDPGVHPPSFASSGFLLGVGDDNIATNNVVVGTFGDPHTGGAFNWEANNEGVWKFENNLAHHNAAGIRVWQVTTRNHVVENFSAYYNLTGIFHGAYANSYRYNKGILYGNHFEVKAASINSNRVRIENMVIDGIGKIENCIQIVQGPLPGEVPVFILNCTLKGSKGAAITNLNSIGEEGELIKGIDVIGCSIEGEPFLLHRYAAPNEFIRVQPASGKSFRISHGSIKNIAPFAPTVWGNGTGLKGEYFRRNDLTDLAFTRVDSNISFSEWNRGVHHLIKSDKYSIRWTGFIQPQFSEEYTFIISATGGYRLWIKDQLITDTWNAVTNTPSNSKPLALIAGEKYPIRLEFFNKKMKVEGGVNLGWKCASLPPEYIPQSQLYPFQNNMDSVLK